MSRKITKIRLSFVAGWCLLICTLVAQENRYTFSAPRLGTLAKLTYYTNNDLDHQNLEIGFFELIDSLNLIFSDYEPNSEINILSQQKSNQFVSVSEPLFELVQFANVMSTLSKGKFDISIGALSKLWRGALRKGIIPKRKQIRRARRSVGFRNIQIDSVNRKIGLSKRGMHLDFGGIAKGYIADKLAAFLHLHGIHQYLIDLGGDLTVGDPPPGSKGWTIAIEWASKTIQVKNTSIATSGPDYQFFVHRGRRYSHIIDPKTGWGIAKPFNTTIICKQGWLADALASVGALVPPDETLQLLMTLDEVDGLMQMSGQIYQSKGFDKYVILNNKN